MIDSAMLCSVTGVAVAFGSAGVLAALRARRATRSGRRAPARAGDGETALAGAARRLAIAARTSVGAVREELVHAARSLAPAADGVLVYEEDEGALRCVAAWGRRFAYFGAMRVALDDTTSLPARAVAAGHRVMLGDAGIAPLHPADTAALAISLALDGERACVLVAASQRALDAETADLLVAIADQAAPAYLIALDRERDRHRAEYDGLTGLLTPRALRSRLAILVERARLLPSARLALLFVDTDHFKRWNDRYGHAAGDALLREIAHVLRSAARREEDLVARNGGDEFCIVFTETDKADAIERADALRRRIASLEVARLIPSGAEQTVRISASIGVAAFAADASTASALLERADAAMYHSKETGRNGVSYTGLSGTFARLPAGEIAPPPLDSRV